MLNNKNFMLVNAGFSCIPLKSVGLCSSLSLSHGDQIAPLEVCFSSLLGQVQSSLSSRANLASLPRGGLLRTLPNALCIIRALKIGGTANSSQLCKNSRNGSVCCFSGFFPWFPRVSFHTHSDHYSVTHCRRCPCPLELLFHAAASSTVICPANSSCVCFPKLCPLFSLSSTLGLSWVPLPCTLAQKLPPDHKVV